LYGWKTILTLFGGNKKSYRFWTLNALVLETDRRALLALHE